MCIILNHEKTTLPIQDIFRENFYFWGHSFSLAQGGQAFLRGHAPLNQARGLGPYGPPSWVPENGRDLFLFLFYNVYKKKMFTIEIADGREAP